MNELVVGVDGSDQSAAALRWAAALASAGQIDLRVVEAWTGGDPLARDETAEQVKAELAEYAVPPWKGRALICTSSSRPCTEPRRRRC